MESDLKEVNSVPVEAQASVPEQTKTVGMVLEELLEVPELRLVINRANYQLLLKLVDSEDVRPLHLVPGTLDSTEFPNVLEPDIWIHVQSKSRF